MGIINKDIKLGGGHRVCDLCGQTIFGSAVHFCKPKDKTISLINQKYTAIKELSEKITQLEAEKKAAWDVIEAAQCLIECIEADHPYVKNHSNKIIFNECLEKYLSVKK